MLGMLGMFDVFMCLWHGGRSPSVNTVGERCNDARGPRKGLIV
jgi:hypothetical protein